MTVLSASLDPCLWLMGCLLENHNGSTLIRPSWCNATVIVASFKCCYARGRPCIYSVWTMTMPSIFIWWFYVGWLSSIIVRPGGYTFSIITTICGVFLHGVVFVVVPEFAKSRPESIKGRASKLSELPYIWNKLIKI